MSSKRILLGITCLITTWAAMVWGAPPKQDPQRVLPSPVLPLSAQPDSSFWIIYDNGTPSRYWPLPDEHDDHYFNVRFTAPDSCKLITAAFFFRKDPADSLGTLPEVHVLAWSSGGTVPNTPPDQPLDSLIIADALIQPYPNPTNVNLESWDLHFGSGIKFHLGWEPFKTEPTDSGLAIISDDGIPSTNYSCEWWGEDVNEWHTFEDDYGIGYGYDLFIRVQIETIAGARVWLEPDQPQNFRICGLYPNPFNPQTSIQIQLEKPQWISLKAYDTAGRFVQEIEQRFLPAGVHYINWVPQGLASGTYLILMQSEKQQATIKATLVR